MTVFKVVEDVAFGAHWPCQTMGRGLCAKIRAGSSPRASREPLVASADEPSVGPEKDRHFSQGEDEWDWECRITRLASGAAAARTKDTELYTTKVTRARRVASRRLT